MFIEKNNEGKGREGKEREAAASSQQRRAEAPAIRDNMLDVLYVAEIVQA